MNVLCVTGRLGNDVEIGTGNVEQAKFSVFVESYGGGEKSGFWLQVVHFKPNQFLKDTLKKGTKVTISGRLDITEYNGKWYTKCISQSIEPQLAAREGQTHSEPQSNSFEDDMPF